MPRLEEIFGEIMAQQPAQSVKASPPDVLMVTLAEYFDDYAAPCRFRPRDLVTPKKSGPMGFHHGEVMIVVEVFDPPIRINGRTDKVGNLNYGARIDIRFLHEIQGAIVPHCGESWMFDAYVPERRASDN